MNKTSLVLTILGQDRPGLVGSLAQVVAEHGANWVESRMAHLAGQFAGILRVEIAAEQAEPLTLALKNLAGAGLESGVAGSESSVIAIGPMQHEALYSQDFHRETAPPAIAI